MQKRSRRKQLRELCVCACACVCACEVRLIVYKDQPFSEVGLKRTGKEMETQIYKDLGLPFLPGTLQPHTIYMYRIP